MTRYFRSFFFQITALKDRFRRNDEPTESMFRKLFDSIAFHKEKDSTADTENQGLVKLADDTDSLTRNSTKDPDGFAKAVQPHQLPDVTALTGISVTEEDTPDGRTGGSGKRFKVSNIMEVSSVHAAITVTQAGPGENVEINFDPGELPVTDGKAKVSSNDTTPGYLSQKIVTDTPQVDISQQDDGADETLRIRVRGRLRECTMYVGTAAEMAVDFPGSYNNDPTTEWGGWAICDGGTYNGIQTRDMRKHFPVGYHSVDYPNINTATYNEDSAGDTGQKEVTLQKANIPAHLHTISNDGTHGHRIDMSTDTGTDAYAVRGAAGSADGILDTNSSSDHNHGGNTGDGSADGLGSTAHENRPPFATVLFVTYVGF